jgi:lipoprotein-anchoring transpeptidase ErfK/SrfK
VRRIGAIVCIAVTCALASGASGARAARVGTPTIATGVMIGTVDVGGMTARQATTAVRRAYYAPLVLRVARHSFSVKTSHFHTAAPVPAAVQTALTAPASTVVPLKPTFSKLLVHKWVDNVAAYTHRRARPGTIVLHRNHPVLFHMHPGYGLKKFSTRILIRNAINTGTRATIVAPLRVLTAPDVKPGPIIVIYRGSNRLILFRGGFHGSRTIRSFPVATGQPIYPTPLGRFEIVIKELNPWWYPPTQDEWAKGLKPVPPGPGNPLGTRWMGLSAPGVGIHGTDEPTSIGCFQIVVKWKDPWWYPPDSPWAKGAKPIPPGPGNPLGTRWMGISSPGVGIHGTPDAASIGYSASHGCIRMQVPDAEWLYSRVQVGTPVFIVSR